MVEPHKPRTAAEPPRPRGLFVNTPPAIFPPILGLFGVGLGWRRAGDDLWAGPAPGAIADMILGAVVLLYLAALVAYVGKILRRPGVVGEDLHTLPGRAGLAAMTLSGMLLALTLAPHWPELARSVLVVALVSHAVLVALVLKIIVTGPPEARAVTPVWHLTFVGFIVGALAAVPLGWAGFAELVMWVSLALAALFWLESLRQFAARVPPEPLRPLLAIHLSPMALIGMVALSTGHPVLGQGLGLMALATLVVLAVAGRWLTRAGFSPFWGAFTFPLAATGNILLMMGEAGFGDIFRVLGNLVLVAATLLNVWIAARVMQMWIRGSLATRTNASVA